MAYLKNSIIADKNKFVLCVDIYTFIYNIYNKYILNRYTLSIDGLDAPK